MSDDNADEVAERRRRNRERQRAYRARKRQERAAQAPEEPERGSSTVAAVVAELAGLPAATRRPGAAATVLRLAEVLDDPTAGPQKPAAARALLDALDNLRDADQATGGRLGELRAVHRQAQHGG